MTAFAHLTNRPCPFALLDPSKLAHGHWRAIAPRTAAIALASPSAEARARQASGAAWSDPARATTRRTGTTVSREVGIGDLETRVAETGQADDRVGPSARGPEEHRQPRVQLVERPPRVARSDLLPQIEAADANPSTAEGEDGAARPRAGFRGEVHDERPERRRIEGRRLLFLGSEKGRAHAGPGERSDGVAGDAVRSALGGDDAGETHHATLRRRVGRSAGVHVIETRAGGRVENAPTLPGGSHGGEGGARTGEGPRQVHGHDPCPGVLRERLDGMARRDARIVHQDVEPAEGLEGGADDRLAGCYRPDRLQARRRLTARGANLLHHRGGDAGVRASPVEPATDVVDDDARAR